MSRIRSKNTGAEKLIFSELRRHKVYFQRHYKKAIGSPDIAIPSRKKAVFIDGDFWHGYKFKKQKQQLPKKYWTAKIEGNILRDKRVNKELKRRGWKVLRLWEHEIKNNKTAVVRKIIGFLK